MIQNYNLFTLLDVARTIYVVLPTQNNREINLQAVNDPP